MTEVVAIVAMAVGDGDGDAGRARPRPGPESIRILTRLAGTAVRCTPATARERPAEGRCTECGDLDRLIHRAHQKMSRAFESTAGNGSGAGRAMRGSFGADATILLFPTDAPTDAATLAQTV